MITDRTFQPAGPALFPGVPNYAAPAPLLCRGGQPTTDGRLALSHAGVALVVDLRAEADAEEARRKVIAVGMAYERIPIRDHHAPTNAQAAEFLALLKEPGAVFVHCHAGVGRTGVLIAAWRLTQGWSVSSALQEASLFHPRILNVTIPFVGGIEHLQETWLLNWATAAGYPLK